MPRLGRPLLALLTGALTVVATAGMPASAAGGAATPVPHYDHIFVIVEENHGFADVNGVRAQGP